MENQKKIYIYHIIIAINVLISLIIFLYDGSLNFSPYTLITFGAKYNPMIASGQYYRLITAMFLHSDITHLLINMYALNILGKNIEFIYGKVKFIIIFIIAGIFGSLGSFIFNSAISVGASGAIFGLFGAYIYLYISRPHIFHYKQLLNLFGIIGINLLFGILFPNIDNWGHIWGLVGGFIVSWSLGIRGENLFSPTKVIAQLLTIILLFTSIMGGTKLNQDTWEYDLFMGIEHLKRNDLSAAQEQFLSGLDKNENIEDFYYYLGHIYYNKGKSDMAKDNFEKAIEINNNFKEAKDMLNKLE